MRNRDRLLYVGTLEDAIRSGEKEQWRESYKLNCDCARAIEKAIEAHYRDNRLADNAAEDVLAEYGFNRVNYVLANTIREKNEDGRFSDENKAWAKSIYVSKDDTNYHFAVEAHPGLTDLFADQVRKQWQELGLYDRTHCVEGSQDQDYYGKICVLKPEFLVEEYRKPEYQLVLITGGSGCDPKKPDRTVKGRFLFDGDSIRIARYDFAGIMKPECLPQWAKQKMPIEIRPEPRPRVSIYQIDPERDANRVKFLSMDAMARATGRYFVDPTIYKEVFSGELDSAEPEQVFEQFNTTYHPLFRGHSLSVSDVIVTPEGAFFCDSVGFQQISFDAAQTQKPDDLMRIVYVEPGRTPYVADLGTDLDSLQKAVGGGLIEPIYMPESVCLVGNEESKLIGMPGNRRLEGDILAGPFFICSCKGEDFSSLSDDEIDTYMKKYAVPDVITEDEVKRTMDFSISFWGTE